jgi:16S rRNA (guanine(966)-N(2))-methyltransferase RsmD
MRIIAGTARGRNLQSPRTDQIRPTSDRARSTLFNVIGPWIEGAVLDLFAGTGALGLEALSRGASRAVFVDSGKEAVKLCERHVEEFGFSKQAEVLALPADRGLDVLQKRGDRFAFIFADPPYSLMKAQWLLERLADSALLLPGGTLLIESDKREAMPTHPAWALFDERELGDTRLRLFRAAAPAAPATPGEAVP